MAMMLSKTYEAFRDAGASDDDKAREAAEEIAGFESRLGEHREPASNCQVCWGQLAFTLAILVILLPAARGRFLLRRLLQWQPGSPEIIDSNFD